MSDHGTEQSSGVFFPFHRMREENASTWLSEARVLFSRMFGGRGARPAQTNQIGQADSPPSAYVAFFKNLIEIFVTIDHRYKPVLLQRLEVVADTTGWKLQKGWKFTVIEPTWQWVLGFIFVFACHIFNIVDTGCNGNIGSTQPAAIASNIDQLFSLIVFAAVATTKGIYYSWSVIVLLLLYDVGIVIIEAIVYKYPGSSCYTIVGVFALVSIALRDFPYVILFCTWIRVFRNECANMNFLLDSFRPYVDHDLYKVLPINTQTFVFVSLVCSALNAIMLFTLLYVIRDGWDWKKVILTARVILPGMLFAAMLAHWVARDTAIRKFIEKHKTTAINSGNPRHIAAMLKLEVEVNTTLLSNSVVTVNALPFLLFVVGLAFSAYFK